MKKYRDYFGKDATCLKDKKLFLFDMDGTIYAEDILYDGTLDLLSVITRQGGRYVFITNNSSKSVEDYIRKVVGLGIEATEDNFFTSAQAAVLYLKKNYPGKLVYCQGTRSLIQELRKSDIWTAEEVSEEAGVILVGFDMELTTEKLIHTCEMLQRDIPYLATNPDLVCPVKFGFISDCGSICGMLENATGRKPVYIGKPEPAMVNIVRKKFNVNAEETVVIGDRLYTDIATGLNAGITAVCVLTGEATEEEIQNSNIKPDFTFNSVKEIFNVVC